MIWRMTLCCLERYQILFVLPNAVTQNVSLSHWLTSVSPCRMTRNRAKLKSVGWWMLAKTMCVSKLTTSSSPVTVLGLTTTGEDEQYYAIATQTFASWEFIIICMKYTALQLSLFWVCQINMHLLRNSLNRVINNLAINWYLFEVFVDYARDTSTFPQVSVLYLYSYIQKSSPIL